MVGERGAEEEEEEEEEEGGDEKTSRPASISPAPRSPPSSQKRPVSSTSSHSSLPLLPPRKKTRDLPNLSNCHSCGLRFSAKGRRDRLQTLKSQWRVVLLCKKCLHSIRSAEVCSYCFTEFPKGGGGFIDCRRCSCRVHVPCIPKQRGYVVPSDLDPNLFTCVDCCAFPKFPGRNPSDFRDVFSARVSLEEMVRDANSSMVKKVEVAARAQEKALVKAMAARYAAKFASNALDLFVLAAAEPPSSAEAVVPDKELALQLHLAMNGSQRISRNQCHVNSDCLIDPKRGLCYGNSLGRESESGSYSVCGKAEVCTENKPFEILELTDAEPLVCISQPDRDSSISLCAVERKGQSKEISDHGKDNPAEMPLKEEQASCSNMITSSSGEDNSIDSVSASCQRLSESNVDLGLSKGSGGDDGGDSAGMQQEKRLSFPDRYLKKYSKRSSRLKATMDMKETLGPTSMPVPCWQMSCSNVSRTFSDAPYQSPTVPVHASAYVNSSSGCQL